MITIDGNSLAGKLYRYWQRRGGRNKYDYQENLCHFVRVCVFWAPWYGFWRHPLFGTFMAPGSVLLVSFFIVCLIIAPALIALVTRILAFLVVILFAASVLWSIGKFWGILGGARNATKRGVKWVWRAVKGDEAWYWFWYKSYTRANIKPWLIVVLIIQVVSLLWVKWIFYSILLIEVVSLLVKSLIFLAFFLAEKEIFNTIGEKVGNASAVVKKPVLGTVGVVASWFMAQKRKVCPYVEIV
ncbi:hypothetical protein E3I18_00045 [Candidatus Woesebacteria bacterium]|nr:MAG: hypothetical protein E3I18_00045 [Candidatus Woesebacteria bacterium]